jgi:hypothetical protein
MKAALYDQESILTTLQGSSNSYVKTVTVTVNSGTFMSHSITSAAIASKASEDIFVIFANLEVLSDVGRIHCILTSEMREQQGVVLWMFEDRIWRR